MQTNLFQSENVPKAYHQPKVSVIVCFYNCEKYITECVNSLMSQSLKDLELIFIDDCSTDRSLTILKETIGMYCSGERIIKIISHAENKGIAFSRDEGINNANGEWIIHCDGDDYVEKDIYESLLIAGIKKNADIVACNFEVFGTNIKSYVSQEADGWVDNTTMLESIGGSSKRKIHGALWNKLIRKELWKNVTIPQGVAYCEDVAALIQILDRRPKIFYLTSALYHYRVHGLSLISTKDSRMYDQCKLFIPFLESLISRENNQERATAIQAKIVDLLYRLLKSEILTLKDFHTQFRHYSNISDTNKQFNFLELTHLKLALWGHYRLAISLGFMNNFGYRLIKWLKKLH